MINALLKKSYNAYLELSLLSSEKKNKVLNEFADLIEKNQSFLLKENQKDLKREQGRLSKVLIDRLYLDSSKLQSIIKGIRDLTQLKDPVNSVLDRRELDNGLILERVRVPLGVIGVIFESRPDVIPQILSLMLKSSNAVVLKGGSEALCTNKAFMKLVEKLNKEFDLPDSWAELIISRKRVHEILKYPEYVSLIIPRGSNALVQSIMKNTKIPVMGHADGICHMYVHSDADKERALSLVLDSKTQYPSACNALETLLVHKSIAETFLKKLNEAAQKLNLNLKGCSLTRKIIPKILRATEKDWKTEHGDLILGVKVVRDLDEAIDHINTYGSKHTDAIVAQDPNVISEFFNRVDSAGVYANASTRFADGYRYGLGAEVGISTAKLHARGPVGLEGLTTYKYRLKGEGHLVSTYVGEKARSFTHKEF